MSIFNVLALVGGLAVFLYGMHTMGEGLAKLSGGKMESILERLTKNRLMAVLLGAGVTTVIQSSSATTVMVVGFVNSGIMKLTQAVGIIFGANIGTTATAWLLSLSGIDGSSLLVELLKPKNFSPILAIIGVGMILFSKRDRRKDIGTIMIGFALLMFGMDMMSGSVSSLKDDPSFTGFFTMFSNPLLGLLAGALLTAVIQSSSASVGILQALCSTGAVAYSSALPIIMGQNIGTCVTTLLSSVGASKNAKRAAFIHFYFNLIGTLLFMGVFYLLNMFFRFTFLGHGADAVGIALIHSVFNISATFVLLPFANLLVKLAEKTVRDQTEPEEEKDHILQLLDARFLEKPAFAVEQCKKTAANMAFLVKEAVENVTASIESYSDERIQKVMDTENLIDRYEDVLGDYMVRLSAKSLSEADSKTISKLLHCIGDFERISDHALNIAEAVLEMHRKNLSFSKVAKEELQVMTSAIARIMDMAIDSFSQDDRALALMVEPLEEVIDKINDELKIRHISRLTSGKCTIESGFVLSDITTNFERIADHCSNIAVCELQMEEGRFEAHDYLENRKNTDEDFKKKFMEFSGQYILP